MGLGETQLGPALKHQCYKVLQSFKGGSLGVQPCTPLCESTSERAFKFPSYFDAVCLLLWFAAKILWEISDVMGSHIYSEMCIWKCSQIFCTRYHCWLCKARNVLHSYMRRHIVVMCPHPPSWPVHRAIKCCVQSDVSRTAPSQVPDVKRGVMVWKPLVQPCIIYLGHKQFYWNIKPKISFTCHNQAFPRSKVRFEPIPFQIWSGIVKFFANQ